MHRLQVIGKIPLVAVTFLVACSTAVETDAPTDTSGAPRPEIGPAAEEPAATEPVPGETLPEEPTVVMNRRVEVTEDYRFPFLLPFDGIRPVYNPEFAPAGDAPYRDDELVIGFAYNGEAKAYSITVLRFREMVNDEVGGIPILVTW